MQWAEHINSSIQLFDKNYTLILRCVVFIKHQKNACCTDAEI